MTASAERFYRTVHHLVVTDPTSSVLEDVRRRYDKDFPRDIDFTGFPYRYTMTMVDALIRRDWGPRPIWCSENRPADDKYLLFARNMVELAQAEYQRERQVPEWVLRFSTNSLSLDPLPPASIVVDCLKVIAIDLGCDISEVATSDERYIFSNLFSAHLLTRFSAQVEVVSNLITRELETMLRPDRAPTTSKCKAICAIIPYAVFLEQHGQQEVANAIMHVIRASRDYHFMSSIRLYVTTLFGKPSSPFRNWLITLVAPYMNWEDEAHGEEVIVGWAAIVSTVPDTEEVIQSVVGTLMGITNIVSLRPHIPLKIWAWMKKWQSLPLEDRGKFSTATPDAVRFVRGLADLEIFQSYFFLVFSGLHSVPADTFNEVEISIREDLGGIGMQGHREDLLNRLGSVIKEVNAEMERDGEVDYGQGLEQLQKLKEVLLDMDRESAKALACKRLTLDLFSKRTDLHGRIQDLIPLSCALCHFSVCDRLGWFVSLRLAPSRHLVSVRPMIHRISSLHSCPLRTVV